MTQITCASLLCSHVRSQHNRSECNGKRRAGWGWGQLKRSDTPDLLPDALQPHRGAPEASRLPDAVVAVAVRRLSGSSAGTIKRNIVGLSDSAHEDHLGQLLVVHRVEKAALTG